MQAIAYLINKLPSSVLNGVSPYERLHDRKPSLDQLRVLGCLCHAKTVQQLAKLAPRTKHAVHMGYSETKKGYILLDLTENFFFVNRDVIFKEDIFPFKDSQWSSPKPLFISQPYNCLEEDLCPMQTNTKHTQVPDISQSSEDNNIPNHEVPEEPVAETNVPESVLPRKSSRGRHPPGWMKDFVSLNVHENVSYALANYIYYDSLSPRYQNYLAAFSNMVEPTSYAEAIKDPRWIEATQTEVAALESNHTWQVVTLPQGKRPIGCKWIFKIKYKASGEVERFKARLVAKGYNQKEGIDYQETFSPVVKMVTLRTVLALAAARHWHIHQMDVFNAFLQEDLEDEIYMDLPQGFQSQGEYQVCRLSKSLYGLKQAPRQWNAKLSKALTDCAFRQSQYDHSLYIRKTDSRVIIILVYVDDILLTGDKLEMIEDTKTALHKAFKIKDLGELKYLLGIEFARSQEGIGIVMHQRKYALELISDTGLSAAKPVATPMEVTTKLTTNEYDEHVKEPTDPKDEALADQGAYQRIIGKLMYLTVTRPDIAYSVQTLSQFLQSPKKSHLEAALRFIRYIKNKPGQGLLLSSKKQDILTAYCDADWAACAFSRKSVTGFAIKLGDSLVS